MMKDRYGNYVIQKCIEFSKGQQRELLLKKITTCANVLRKQANYSRHVYNFIEKLLAQESGSTPTQGGPKQGHGHSAHNGQSVNNNHYEHVNTYIFGAN